MTMNRTAVLGQPIANKIAATNMPAAQNFKPKGNTVLIQFTDLVSVRTISLIMDVTTGGIDWMAGTVKWAGGDLNPHGLAANRF